MKLLQKALTEGSFLLDLEARDLRAIFRRVMDLAIARGVVPPERRQEVEGALLAREEQFSTAIGHGVGVPHAYFDFLTQPLIVLVRLAHPLNLGAPDGIPTRFLFVLIGPTARAGEHLDTLTAIARLMSDDDVRYELSEAPTQLEILAALQRFVARTTSRPVRRPSGPPEGLRYTGRWFGGLTGDLRRRLPHYASDFREGLHSKCIASVLFLFFACFAPAVTFGGIMAELTDNHLGAVEMILATAVCGVLYSLLAGQPLIILGGTGPLLIFTAMLYRLCSDLEIVEHFFAVYAWVGLWTALMLLVLAATDASCLIRYLTRFTDEIFAAFISLIYIYEAIKALVSIFISVYRRETISHDRALVPLLLAMGTFFIAINLARIRRSRYLLPKIREFLSDFGPSIAIAAMTRAALGLHQLQELNLQGIPAPDELRPTYIAAGGEPRSWLVNPLDAPVWTWWMAVGPAALASVLLFLNDNITARLINNPDHNLRKGEAYHLNLAVVGGLVGLCSIFGLPWLMASTVRSLNHLRSLATVEEVIKPGGEVREHIMHVRENRVTNLAIHILIGLSLLLLPLLGAVPMAVLYGLFLYMGVISMAGNQFFERLNLWLMDPSLYPSTHYIRKVPLGSIHAFTAIQLLCLAVLWIVNASPLGILFPLFVALLVPVRMLLARFFDHKHLEALDAEEIPEEEEMHWT